MMPTHGPYACRGDIAGVPFLLRGGYDGPDWWIGGVTIAPEDDSEEQPVPSPVRALVRMLERGHDEARGEGLARCRWPVGTTVFRRRVLSTLCTGVATGETCTYGELAALCENPKAARAVGSALAANPFPILIPCHRVVAASGIGGFMGSADGTALKARLLAAERDQRRDDVASYEGDENASA